jgi:Holliday junction resolvase
VSTPSKRKGSNGERDAAKKLAEYGLTEARRHPMSGILADFPGDLALHGFCVEVKRTERLDLPGAIRQAAAAARGDTIPVVIFRRNQGKWYVCEPLESWAPRVAELRQWTEGW